MVRVDPPATQQNRGVSVWTQMNQGIRPCLLARALLLAPALLAPGLSVLPAPATAQVIDTVRVRAGLGAKLTPEFIGDDSMKFAPLVKFNLKRGEGPFKFGAPDDNFGIAVVSGEKFSAGPTLKFQGSRKNSEVGAEVGKVPTTFEAGAFVQYQVSDSVRLRSELRKGIGGHRGLVGSVGADKVWRDGDRYLFSVGPRVAFSDGRYQRAYFGVDDEAALATGLEPYRPGGGIHGAGVVASAHYQLGESAWGLFGFAEYQRLLGDSADSPIVREYGSPNQFSVGAAITRTFNLKL